MDQPPSGGGGRKGLVIGAFMLVLLLIGGGIVAAVALSGDDKGDARGEEESSQTPPTDDPSEAVDTEEPEVTGFEATNFDEVSRVCDGEAMTNAAEWDPAAAVGLPFFTDPAEPEGFRSLPLGATQQWSLKEFDAFETVNFVLCAQSTPSETLDVQQCKAEGGRFEWHPVDWTVTAREAATGDVLHEFDPYVESQSGCPSVASIDDDGKARSVLDSRAVEGDVGAWLVEAGMGEPGEDGEQEAAPFEATSYLDLSRVCLGGAATNLAEFDPAKPRAATAMNSKQEPNYSGSLTVGVNRKWGADFQDWQGVNLVVCVDGQPSKSIKPRKCKAELEKEKGNFTYVQYDWSITLREAATGKELTQLEAVEPTVDSCPLIAMIDEDGVFVQSPDTRKITERVDAWLADQKG